MDNAFSEKIMKYNLNDICSEEEDLWQDPLKTKIFSSLPTNSIIIDGGCRDGDWIHAVTHYLKLNLNIEKEKFILVGIDPIYSPSIFRYNFYVEGAISNENKKQASFFIVENEPGCNSLKRPSDCLQESIYDNKRREISKVEKIKTYRLDKIISNIINRTEGSPGYLKLDVQGSELECLEGAGKFLKEFMFIETEIGLDKNKNFYDQGSELDEVIEVLNNKNFEPILYTKYSGSPLPEGEIIFKNKNWNLDNKKWI
tara:strand:+ start:7640 stop:8407 length:768 start_codon:yes stop_codon:yes gene_type:complete